MTAPDMLTAALRYAARGWPVFPVRIDGSPHIAHGFHAASADVEQVRRWWTTWPAAGIGAPTGIAFDVLDVDDHTDTRPPIEWAEGHPGVSHLPPAEVHTWQARSGGGGWHLFFKPTGLGRRVKFDKDDRPPKGACDWLGTDGYVILPPSPHASGGRYAWIWSPDDVELADAPVALAVYVARSKAERGTPAGVQDRTPARPSGSSPTTTSRGQWNPLGILGRVAVALEGERNTVTNWAAWKIGMDVHEGKASRRAADDAVAELARIAIGTGLDPREVERTITSGYGAGLSGRAA